MNTFKKGKSAAYLSFCLSVAATLTFVFNACFAAVEIVDPCSIDPAQCGGGGDNRPIPPELMPNWPLNLPAGDVITSSLSIGDLNADASLEIMAGVKKSDGTEGVSIWNKDGTLYGYFATGNYSDIKSSPAVADIDLEADPSGKPEVVATDGFKLYVWHANGALSWNKTFGNIPTAPVLANLDTSDQKLEVLVGVDADKKLYAWNHDGTGLINANGLFAEVSGNIYSSPAVGDLDADGQLEVAVTTQNTSDESVYIWRLDGIDFLDPSDSRPGLSKGCFATRSGASCSPISKPGLITEPPVASRSSLVIADIDGDRKAEVILGSNDGGGAASAKLFVWRSVDVDGNLMADPYSGWAGGKTLIGRLVDSVAVADIDKGTDGLEIIVSTKDPNATQKGHIFAFHRDGSLVTGWPVNMNFEITSSPVVADIDGDRDMEVIAGAGDGKLYAWHANGTQGSAIFGWPMVIGDASHPVQFSPALGHINNNNVISIVAASDNKVGNWFIPGDAYQQDKVQWGKFRKDAANSGTYQRNKIFSDDFTTSFNKTIWTVQDRATCSGGFAVLEGEDGSVFRSDSITSKLTFNRDKDLIFLVEGFSFSDINSGFNITLYGGRRYLGHASSPFRRMWLSEDGGSFKVWTEIDTGRGTFFKQMVADLAPAGAPNQYPAISVNTQYSAAFHWVPNYSGTDGRLDFYLFKTEEGMASVRYPVYSWSGSVGNPMDWNPRIAIGMYPGRGQAKVDRVVVYGSMDGGNTLDQRAPVFTEIIPKKLTYDSGQCVYVTASFTRGSDDPPNYQNPHPISYLWTTHQSISGFAVPVEESEFSMFCLPRVIGDFWFTVRLISVTGVVEAKKLLFRVRPRIQWPEPCGVRGGICIE